MEHYKGLEKVRLDSSWVTIGTFDGVHLGHQQIVAGLVEHAHQAGQPAVVITFHPHPKIVLGRESRPFYLTLPDKRAQLFGEMGVDVVITHPFNDQISQLSARAFIQRLHDHLRMEKLWVGYDFALGKDREGNPPRLRELGEDFGYTVHEVSSYTLHGEIVSSSRIRELLRQGKAQQAARFLGRLFQLKGQVIGGDKRGKDLGFPTANLDVPREMVQIKPGIYATLTSLDGQDLPSVTNVGFRPTFDDGMEFPIVETFILDFSGDLYGMELEVSFHTYLREEIKFESVPALIAKMEEDVERAREILNA